ncbi:MAG: HAD family phosphatase [Saprospiraceae bacterium]|nr:HAD family phosphatase [Saprospiraceae bacterium]
MPAIQNIIFDFGNVLFDLDLDSIGRQMSSLVGDRYEQVHQRLQHDKVFELYETGGLSTEEFIDAIRHAGEGTLSAEQIVAAWNSIFIGMPRARFDLLLQLRQQYQVFLLSNINALHADWIDAYLLREHGITDFQSRYFDGVYYSHLIRLRKPEREIYEYVLADAELVPGQTLFFDDLEANVEAARRLGILGIRHDPKQEIAEHVWQALQRQTTEAG